MQRAPYLKAAILFALPPAIYGGYRLATWMLRPHAQPRPEMAMGHAPRGFVCKFRLPPKDGASTGAARRQPQLLFTWTCVPDCRYKPEAGPSDKSSFLGMITAEQTTPAIWHRACDGK